MLKEMLSVLMDGINDAAMIMDYAEKAKAADDDTFTWFFNHAKARVDLLWDDYKRINEEISLEARAADGDEIAEALKCHLKNQINQLKNRITSI